MSVCLQDTRTCISIPPSPGEGAENGKHICPCLHVCVLLAQVGDLDLALDLVVVPVQVA